ncbi:hypothetical protein SSABA_v1c07080 [Spiroplasma sabaudiense Ar-1343]|uniref:Uncharacterized protein n=1 Tax=Spiroplasma sabaudiense Ar-1343 TaxID=1276257 RepID=W6AB77_9MOLU|nr:hypothetical protein [Spiroplasma sabaudiense]AHI54110.1 hypothetical protein SSABA_v1c07080 [Spiroplasma sabaudiense Ar-1343]
MNALNTTPCFKKIQNVKFRGSYFLFESNGEIYGTNGYKVVSWREQSYIGEVNYLFSQIPKWINFFISSISNFTEQNRFKRGKPSSNPFITKVIETRTHYLKDGKMVYQNKNDYVVVPPNSQNLRAKG